MNEIVDNEKETKNDGYDNDGDDDWLKWIVMIAVMVLFLVLMMLINGDRLFMFTLLFLMILKISLLMLMFFTFL